MPRTTADTSSAPSPGWLNEDIARALHQIAADHQHIELQSRSLAGQLSGPGPHYTGVGNQVPLKERVRLGEITDSSWAVADRGSRFDDRPEDGLTGLLTETLISHIRRRYLFGTGNQLLTANLREEGRVTVG